jgi:hypothetical protein
MEQIEATVGERDRPAFGSSSGDRSHELALVEHTQIPRP